MTVLRSPALRLKVLAVLSVGALATLVSACSSDQADRPAAQTSRSTTTRPVPITTPAVPPDTKDCGTLDELAGWPTTTTTPPAGYACIVDAAAVGTPAQMSVVAVGSGMSGRKTRDGFDIPTRRITTWLVVGPHEVQETRDQTEDGGPSTTQTCTGLALGGPRPQGTGCE